MPFKIQRVPRGLNELLSLSGGQTPIELEDRVQSVLELLQLYGSQQLQTQSGNNAALAEAGTVAITLHATLWTVLFAAQATVVKTATMTALRLSCMLQRTPGVPMQVRQEELGPFGATETGIIGFGHWFSYPLLCPPGTQVFASPTIIGTDATANVSVRAEFGVLG